MKAFLYRRFAFTFALAFGVHAGAATEVGKVLLSKGQVLILDKDSKVVADPEGKRGRKTSTGAVFFEGETIQTGADGRVKIAFIQGGNEVVLGGGTSLFIEKATPTAQGPANTTLSLARGEIRSDVKKKYSGEGDDKYEVRTKNAVAGVRGTIFVAKFDPKANSSQFATQKGLVAVSPPPVAMKDGVKAPPPPPPVMVPAGSFTASVGNAPPIPARPIASNPELSKSIQKLEGSSDGSSDSSDDSAAKPGEGPSKGTAGGDAPKDKQDGKEGPAKGGPAPASQANGDAPKSEGGGDVPLGREPVVKTDDAGRGPTSAQGAPPPPGQLMGDSTRPRAPIAPSVPNFSQIQNNTSDMINRVNQTRQVETRSTSGNVTIKIE